MLAQEKKARSLVKAQSTKRLIEQFELTNAMNGLGIPMVRGWIMDELEARDRVAFDAWLDSDDDSPRRFYVRKGRARLKGHEGRRR